MCETCGIKANGFHDKIADGKCAYCRATLTFSSLIYINPRANGGDDDTSAGDAVVDKMVHALTNFATLQEERGGSQKQRGEDKVQKVEKPSKINVLMDIINSAGPHGKILVFATNGETIKQHIMPHLDKHGLRYYVLAGTQAQIADIIEGFKGIDVDILLVDSAAKCAGMNLQFITDVVFYHYIGNPAVCRQIVGRGQRIGRAAPLNVRSIYYDYEAASDGILVRNGKAQFAKNNKQKRHGSFHVISQ